jgi:hypothetical protein
MLAYCSVTPSGTVTEDCSIIMLASDGVAVTNMLGSGSFHRLINFAGCSEFVTFTPADSDALKFKSGLRLTMNDNEWIVLLEYREYTSKKH